MNAQTLTRLFGVRGAWDDLVARSLILTVVALFAFATISIALLSRRGLPPERQRELSDRMKSWAILAPLMAVPILLGAATTIIAVLVLSLGCYREFARATGLFREKAISAGVAAGIFAVAFAIFDNWYRLFGALFPLVVGAVAAIAIFQDRPEGYIQRVGLGVFGFAFFGVALGHLGFFANDANFRAILLWLLLTTQLNDVIAYTAGKTLGKRGPLSRRLSPQTSPNKTVAGALGAVLLTTPIVALIGHFVFQNTRLDAPLHLLMLGLIVSVLGQMGDLMLSSIKRDLGIKDMASTFPGHGGLLDRFDSLILVAPAVFHYVNAWNGVGLGQQVQIFSAHWFSP